MKRKRKGYSLKVAKEICKHITNGLNYKDSAHAAGIAEGTLYKWMSEKLADGSPNPYYHDDLVELMKDATVRYKEVILKSFKKEKAWQAKAWLLERKFKDEFSTKQLKEEKIAKTVTIQIVPDIPQGISPQQRLQLEEAFKVVPGELVEAKRP